MLRTLSVARKWQRLAARSIYVPKGVEPIHTSPELTVYRYALPTDHGLAVLTFWGSAGKPTSHYRYRTLEAANRHVEQWIDRVSLHRVEQMRKRATEAAWTRARGVQRVGRHTTRGGGSIAHEPHRGHALVVL